MYYIFTQINSQRAFDVLSAEITHNEKFNLFNMVCNDKHYNHIYNDLNYRKINRNLEISVFKVEKYTEFLIKKNK